MATAISKVTPFGGADLGVFPVIGNLAITATGAAGSTETLPGDPSSIPNISKRAFVVRFTVNGQEVDMLVRVQSHNGCLWIDLAASQSIAELTTTVGALNLGPLGACHPSPAKDTIDTLAMIAAGGS